MATPNTSPCYRQQCKNRALRATEYREYEDSTEYGVYPRLGSGRGSAISRVPDHRRLGPRRRRDLTGREAGARLNIDKQKSRNGAVR